jgi:hypothetical protein
MPDNPFGIVRQLSRGVAVVVVVPLGVLVIIGARVGMHMVRVIGAGMSMCVGVINIRVMVVMVVITAVSLERVVRMGVHHSWIWPGKRRGDQPALRPQHPQPEPQNQQCHGQGQHRLGPRGDQPARPKRGKQSDEHNAADMGERNENAEYNCVDGPASRADDIRSGDRLAMPRRCRVYHASPEAGRQVKQRLMHRVSASSPVTFALRSGARP